MSDARTDRPIEAAPIRIVCAQCGGTDVSRDAWADWDEARQQWMLGHVFDDGHCHRCEQEVALEEEPLRDADKPMRWSLSTTDTP